MKFENKNKVSLNIFHNGDQFWFLSYLEHRLNGPASIYPNGTRVWVQYNKYHRTDGPAYISCDGREEWWENDERIK